MSSSPVPGSPSFRWFPGYTVAGAATVAYIATAPGQTFVVSQLNGPLREAFGIGELGLNTAYAVATVLASLPLVLVGNWTDRVGPRLAVAGVAGAFGLACVSMALATGFWGVAFGFFLLRFLGQGALSMASQHATAMWFHRRLGSIHGIKQVVVFSVWVVFPQVTLWLITSVGWRWTYGVFAGAIWVGVIPMALLAIRDRPEDVGLAMDGDSRIAPQLPLREGVGGPGVDFLEGSAIREPLFNLHQALRTRAYWVLAAGIFLAPLIGTAFLFDIQPMLARRGMDAQAAAFAVSAWTAGMAIMALPAGGLADRFRPSVLIPLGMAVIGVSAPLLWGASSAPMAAAALVAFAVGQSLVGTTSAVTLARYFGRAHHGAIRASTIRLGVLGTGLGPFVSGLSAHRTGGYLASTLVFTALCIPVLFLAMGLRQPEAPPSDPLAVP